MDLLNALLADASANARPQLLDALLREVPALEELSYNVFEVVLDRERREARIFDVLDGHAPPTVVAFDELQERLG